MTLFAFTVWEAYVLDGFYGRNGAGENSDGLAILGGLEACKKERLQYKILGK